MKTRVLIVDDDALVRTLLGTILEKWNIEVVGHGEDGDQVPALVAGLRPDVVVMDLRMARVDGIEATKRLRAIPDAPDVLALTSFDTEAAVIDAVQAGVKGFLAKDAAPEEIAEAVLLVARGEGALSPRAARVLIRHARTPAAAGPLIPAGLPQLTGREQEAAAAATQGLSNAQIARQMHVSEATVKTHLASAMGKVGVENRVQLAVAMALADEWARG